MITKIQNGNLVLDGSIQKADLYIRDGKILAIGGEYESDLTIDAKGAFVSAGFVDLHCHGGGGFDFNTSNPDAVRTAVNTHLEHGTTSLFPTVTSTTPEQTAIAIDTIESVRSTLPSMQGVHLEGPYLSAAQTGAQNPDALKKPPREEYEAMLEAHKIARWDYAPENDEQYAFLEALLAHGVLPSAAHTDATCTQMEEAAKRGCRLITHLYSCTSTIRREKGFRIAGVLEAAYLVDDINVELIADGCHLPHELLRLAYKLKGPDRIALITDAMSAAGLGVEGEFELGGVPCVVEDGVAKLLDRSAFAGSVATADRLVRTCLAAGIPMVDTIKMITKTPAAIMGLENKGCLAPDMDADIVMFDENVEILAVILGGEIVKGKDFCL